MFMNFSSFYSNFSPCTSTFRRDAEHADTVFVMYTYIHTFICLEESSLLKWEKHASEILGVAGILYLVPCIPTSVAQHVFPNP